MNRMDAIARLALFGGVIGLVIAIAGWLFGL
jgi:hypothetical protein